MGLLDSVKNIVEGKSPNDPVNPGSDNRVDRQDQCQVIWYQWINPLVGSGPFSFSGNPLGAIPTSVDVLRGANDYDISNHIESFTYSKSMDSAAGSFSFVVHNSFNWARFMRPGEWIVVYLANDGSLPISPELPGDTVDSMNESLDSYMAALSGTIPTSVGGLISTLSTNLLPQSIPPMPFPSGPDFVGSDNIADCRRVIGIISRVGIRSITNPDGTVETSYHVTGKDFGTVYEETELWFNANSSDQSTFIATMNSITQQYQRNLSDLLNKWHDIFLNPGLYLKNIATLTSFFPQQWLVPDQLAEDLQLDFPISSSGFFGELSNVKEFAPTVFENPDPNALAGIEGRAWDRLKSLSQPEFHELFTELSDQGNPKIYFRPIPWALNTANYPVLGSAMLKYSQLTSTLPVPPPLPIGLNLNSLGSLASLTNTALASAGALASDALGDIRLIHSVPLTAIEVESWDVGPDYHSRFNFFLVSSSKSGFDQTNAFTTIAASAGAKFNFPSRNEDNIKRTGFKPMIVNVSSILTNSGSFFQNGKFFQNSPSQEFILEVNEMMKDFHGNDQDFYSGTMTIMGRTDIKLGRVIITDTTFNGIDNMVFYIEGYEDNFNVNPDGTTNWTQTLHLTRGMTLDFLNNGASPIYRPGVDESTFQPNVKPAASGPLGALNTIKKFL